LNKPDLSALSHGEALRYFRKHASLRPHELPALDHGTGPRALRRSGLTQEQLAHRGGLSVRTIRNIESGQNVPEAESVHVLVNALELSEEQRTLFEAAVERERARRRERGQGEARERERVRLARTGNLPPAVTDFVGREAEVAAVTRELETTRLLTLTGPGGCGKTQLALRAADELRGRYDGGVWLVALAAVDDANLLVPTVARALGIGESLGSDDPLAVLAGFFAAASTLLLLDTCEHLSTPVPRWSSRCWPPAGRYTSWLLAARCSTWSARSGPGPSRRSRCRQPGPSRHGKTWRTMTRCNCSRGAPITLR